MVALRLILRRLNVIRVIGEQDIEVNEVIPINPLNRNRQAIMWGDAKNQRLIRQIKTGIVICENIDENDISDNCTYLIVSNPRSEFRKLLVSFFKIKHEWGIAKSARIHKSAVLGENIAIGENVVIESGCQIGDGSFIGHNTVIKANTIIGLRVVIGANNTIGGAGFGYEKSNTGEYEFIPHIGNVVIGDFVEIGNNTCIDRAVLGSTILDKNVKVDNLVHIAHGVKIGVNSMIIANSMIAGSTVIGANVWVAPSASVLNKLKIGNDSLIGLGAVVLKSVAEKDIVVGNPAKSLKKGKRIDNKKKT